MGNRLKLILFSTFGLILLLSALPWTVWKISNSYSLNVAIIDKTVPDTSYREHKGLMWILNQQKYLKKDQSGPYQYSEDYYGFHPKPNKQYDIRDIPDNLDQADLVYITDAYGVFEDEYYGTAQTNNRSGLIYGGLNPKDLEKIKKAVYKGKTLIAEFNTFGSPTEPNTREELNSIMGLSWSGWMGRYFSDLSKGTEVPNWVISSYEKKQHTEWNFRGPGLLLISNNDDVLVFGGKDASCEFNFTDKGKKFFGMERASSYNYWFDMVQAQDEQEVLATYSLKLNDNEKQKLASYGLTPTFPAIIKHDTGIYTSYYFSGDYADNKDVPAFYQFAGLDKLMQWFTLDSRDSEQPFFFREYVPMMKKILSLASSPKEAKKPLELHQEGSTYMMARTHGKELQTYTQGTWQTHYAKGVNMGMALPGKWFTEFPKQESTYLQWFDLIGKMNSNTIRVYTLMDPSFYHALSLYNNEHMDHPLWLLQEIWPEEHPKQNNFLDKEYQVGYHTEIENVVNAIHGNANIPQRQGRAYGSYTTNISSYVLGYLVGRELEPDEVDATNQLNAGFQYQGDYLSAKEGTPTENWLAESCDYVLQYEEHTYHWQHPVAIVSWPTLDPMEHDSEWNPTGDKSKQYNDRSSVDIKNIKVESKMKAGLFGAYHIYPNYPDFMNNEEKYDAYHDEQGRFRYGGYLQEFIAQHGNYPAIVAEFGLATGMGNAHKNPDGYNHGGNSEAEQGKGIVRMAQAIRREGYAGSIIFEWMDEWAKKTWTTEPFMIPYDRHALWHNAIDPEQNYGIMAMESAGPGQPPFILKGDGNIQEVRMNSDPTYFYVDVSLKSGVDLTKQELLIGLDTYDKNRGETRYRPDIPVDAPTGMEFLIDVQRGESAKLLAEPSYNSANRHFSSTKSSDGKFEEAKRLINRSGVMKNGKTYEEQWEDSSTLHSGTFEGSQNQWYVENNVLHFRIPWGRLNVTDPTTLTVLDDPRTYNDDISRDTLATSKTDGIRLTALLSDTAANWERFPEGSTFMDPPVFTWKPWDIPTYKERLKGSYSDIQKYFQSIP